MNIKIDTLKPPKQDLFKSGRFRSIVIQSIVMFLFISFVLWVVNNTATNMTANGIAHGFDFLWENSMFEIGYLPFIDHTPVDTYFHAFIVGILNEYVNSFRRTSMRNRVKLRASPTIDPLITNVNDAKKPAKNERNII